MMKSRLRLITMLLPTANPQVMAQDESFADSTGTPSRSIFGLA